MVIPSLRIQIELMPEERKILEDFFTQTREFLESEDMLSSNNIGLYADLYMNYLINSGYQDNESLKIFHHELKLSEQREQMVESGSVTLSPKERIYRKSMPASSSITRCKNGIINKWRKEARIVHTVSITKFDELNKSIEPILEQNAKERKLSWEAARNLWVGKKY